MNKSRRFPSALLLSSITALLLLTTLLSTLHAAPQPKEAYRTDITPLAPTPFVPVGAYLGGDLDDISNAIALGPDGAIYIAGLTQSNAFPLTPTLRHAAAPEHGEDAFVAKFSPDGQELLYLLWINATDGNRPDEAYDVVVDDTGAAYVTGRTRSVDFCDFLGNPGGFDPIYNGNGGDHDAFLFKINPTGTAVEFCTFIGGSDEETGQAIALDQQGRVYVVGGTWSADFPFTNETHSNTVQMRDTFLVRLSGNGQTLDYGTLIGGAGQDEARGVAVDEHGRVYVTGWTFSADFPVTANALQAVRPGGAEAFLYVVEPDRAGLVYASYVGGIDEDRGTAVVVGQDGKIYLGGYTLSTDFPTTNGATQPSYIAGYEGFVMGFEPLAAEGGNTAVVYSTFVGGGAAGEPPLGQNEWVRDVQVDACGRVTAVGESSSPDFPTTPNAWQHERLGPQAGFITQLAADGTAVLFASYWGGTGTERITSVVLDAQGNPYWAGSSSSADLSFPPMSYNGQNSGSADAFFAHAPLDTQSALTPTFTAVPTSGPPPLWVQFENLTGGDCLTAFLWSFGDGVTSTLTSVGHLYEAVGVYTATLQVVRGGDTAVAVQRIVVEPYRLYLPLIHALQASNRR